MIRDLIRERAEVGTTVFLTTHNTSTTTPPTTTTTTPPTTTSTTTTTLPPVCGDGNVDPGETCDPPGSLQGGGHLTRCRDDCTFCGDGIVNGAELCDDGTAEFTEDCDVNCPSP